MSGQIVHLESDPHVAVQKLLPWYLTGRLEAAERAGLDAHLASCPDCRSELESERQLRSLRVDPEACGDIEQGWAKMQQLLDSGAPPSSASRAHAPSPRRIQSAARRAAWLFGGGLSTLSWAAPGALSVALAIALIATVRPMTRSDASYHVLAAAADDSATAVVRFHPEATEAQIRRSLNECGARLVDGPTVTNAYVVRLSRDQYAAALDKLRRQPAVTLVEALEGTTAR